MNDGAVWPGNMREIQVEIYMSQTEKNLCHSKTEIRPTVFYYGLHTIEKHGHFI